MPFSLRNAGQTFQRLMDTVGACPSFVFIHLDDVLVASPDEATLVDHLRTVFQRLRDFSLLLNISKCSFGQSQVHNSWGTSSWTWGGGRRTSGEAPGGHPGLSEATGCEGHPGLPRPRQLIQEIHTSCCQDTSAARILLLLTSALARGKKAKLEWSLQMEAAFEAAKAALCRVMSLAHPDPSAAISLACDASDSHVGAVLQQWSPKGCSKKLDVTQKYSTFDRELLAVYLAVRHFRFLLEGRQFHVETDHKLLTFALHRTSEPGSARQQRQLSYLAEFSSDI